MTMWWYKRMLIPAAWALLTGCGMALPLELAQSRDRLQFLDDARWKTGRDVLNAADQCLYRAKKSGRNRVVVDRRGAGPLDQHAPSDTHPRPVGAREPAAA